MGPYPNSRARSSSNGMSPRTISSPAMQQQQNAGARCSVALCTNGVYSHGLCSMHLSRGPSQSDFLPRDSYSSNQHASGYSSQSMNYSNASMPTPPTSRHSNPRVPAYHPYSPVTHAQQRSYDSYGAKNSPYNNAPSRPNLREYDELSNDMKKYQDQYSPRSNNHSNHHDMNATMMRDGNPSNNQNESSPSSTPFNSFSDMGTSYSSGTSNSYTPPNSNQEIPRGSVTSRSRSSHTESDDISYRNTDSPTFSGSENSDGTQKETVLRRERNRIAARKSRQRKLDKIQHLEEEKSRLERHRDSLVQEIKVLENRGSGAIANNSKNLSDHEYIALQDRRTQIILNIEEAYNLGNMSSVMKYFREDTIVSGPQNCSAHLSGKSAIMLDYLCTSYLFKDFELKHSRLDSGGPRSQHFRVHWVFKGKVKQPGENVNEEFVQLIRNVVGKEVTIEGVSNYSFSGDKVVYVHRTADQAKFLSALVMLGKS